MSPTKSETSMALTSTEHGDEIGAALYAPQRAEARWREESDETTHPFEGAGAFRRLRWVGTSHRLGGQRREAACLTSPDPHSAPRVDSSSPTRSTEISPRRVTGSCQRRW